MSATGMRWWARDRLRRLVRAVAPLVLVCAAGPASALYDPPPDDALAAAQGEWQGTLTYRDYSQPDRRVTLPTRLFIALGGPSALAMYFSFDDGPSRTVHSYERMAFDFATRQLHWSSGPMDRPPQVHTITAMVNEGPTRTIRFERAEDKFISRHVLVLSPVALSLTKEEVPASGEASFRNRYEFVRPGPR